MQIKIVYIEDVQRDVRDMHTLWDDHQAGLGLASGPKAACCPALPSRKRRLKTASLPQILPLKYVFTYCPLKGSSKLTELQTLKNVTLGQRFFKKKIPECTECFLGDSSLASVSRDWGPQKAGGAGGWAPQGPRPAVSAIPQPCRAGPSPGPRTCFPWPSSDFLPFQKLVLPMFSVCVFRRERGQRPRVTPGGLA